MSLFSIIFNSPAITTRLFPENHGNRCAYAEKLDHCLRMGVLQHIPTFGMIWTLFGIAFERTYASATYKTYEAVKSRKLAIGVTVCQVNSVLFNQVCYDESIPWRKGVNSSYV